MKGFPKCHVLGLLHFIHLADQKLNQRNMIACIIFAVLILVSSLNVSPLFNIVSVSLMFFLEVVHK